MLKAICDAGPIIHLDELNCLDLLNDFSKVILPKNVFEEVKKHRPSISINSEQILIIPSIESPTEEPLLTLCQIFSLDAGEIDALVLMVKNHNAIFLTDDSSARLAVEHMGFKVHGTIGILIRSIRRGQKKRKILFTFFQKCH